MPSGDDAVGGSDEDVIHESVSETCNMFNTPQMRSILKGEHDVDCLD